MIEWNLDRLFRSATACLALATVLVGATAFLVNGYSTVDNVLGMMLVGTIFVGLGGVVGSLWTSTFGIVLFAAGAVLAETPNLVLGVVGCVGFSALALVDLSITVRGAPAVRGSVWQMAAVTIGVVVVVSMIFAGLAYVVATSTTFAAILLPVGVVSIGYAIRLATEAHERTVPK